MTKETRHFIELSDILSFQFRCKKCEATISRPLADFHGNPLDVCQNCSKDWVEPKEVDKTTQSITDFVQSIRDVKRIIERKQFTLQIEISCPRNEVATQPVKESS